MTAQGFFRLDQMGAITAPSQHPRAFKPGGTSADDKDEFVSAARLKTFGMPAATVFLEGGSVLRAPDCHAIFEAGDALVAADAFRDVLASPLVNLAGQPGIGDRGPCTADNVELA